MFGRSVNGRHEVSPVVRRCAAVSFGHLNGRSGEACEARLFRCRFAADKPGKLRFPPWTVYPRNIFRY